MPTDAERLAVAEEIIATLPGQKITVEGRCYAQHGGKRWYAYRGNGDSREIAVSDDLIQCICIARAKLSAEREAALPEEAKRWKTALEEIVKECRYGGLIADIARKALEQGAK